MYKEPVEFQKQTPNPANRAPGFFFLKEAVQ